MLLRLALLAILLAAGAVSSAFARWNEAKTRHFIIYSEQNPEDLAEFAERLERFDGMVRQVRKMEDPELTDGARVTIYVLPSVGALQALYARPNRDRYLASTFRALRARSLSSATAPTNAQTGSNPNTSFSTNICIT